MRRGAVSGGAGGEEQLVEEHEEREQLVEEHEERESS